MQKQAEDKIVRCKEKESITKEKKEEENHCAFHEKVCTKIFLSTAAPVPDNHSIGESETYSIYYPISAMLTWSPKA